MACKLSLLPDPRLAEYASSLHASTDFREKLYKILQYVAKLAAAQPRLGPLPKQIASTLSQSRGIFKLLKSVNSLKSLSSALLERGLVRQAKVLEACLSITVNSMQDVSAVNRLCGGSIVGRRFSWLTDFLDLMLALFAAGLAARAMKQLHASGADLTSPGTRRKLLLCGRREDRTRATCLMPAGHPPPTVPTPCASQAALGARHPNRRRHQPTGADEQVAGQAPAVARAVADGLDAGLVGVGVVCDDGDRAKEVAGATAARSRSQQERRRRT